VRAYVFIERHSHYCSVNIGRGLRYLRVAAVAHQRTRAKNAKAKGRRSSPAGTEPPPTNKVQSPVVARQGGVVKKHFFDKDKEYFVRLCQTTKEKWKQTVVITVGMVALLVVLFLNLFTSLVNDWILAALWLAIWALIVVAWQRINKKPEVKKVTTYNFNPVSVGTLYFGFGLSLWNSVKAGNILTYVIPVIVFIASAAFVVAVFSQPVRTFMNTRAAPIVLPLTFWALLLGFALNLLPAFSRATEISWQAIVYFGFLWFITILLVMYRDVIYEPVRILTIIFFIVVAGTKFYDQNAVGYIGGATLLLIALLMYCVAVGRIHPFGKLEE
jgi:hypothetical protein